MQSGLISRPWISVRIIVTNGTTSNGISKQVPGSTEEMETDVQKGT